MLSFSTTSTFIGSRKFKANENGNPLASSQGKAHVEANELIKISSSTNAYSCASSSALMSHLASAFSIENYPGKRKSKVARQRGNWKLDGGGKLITEQNGKNSRDKKT